MSPKSCKSQNTSKGMELNIDKDLNCYIEDNIKLPSHANGILRYHITFNISVDSSITSIILEDYYNVNCQGCEDSLKDVVNSIRKWPFKLPVEIELPCSIKNMITIDLLNYPIGCD